MRLLFFQRWVGSRKGGTETQIRELAWRLAKRGHSVGILTREGMYVRELEGMGLKAHIVSKNWREPPFSYVDSWRYFHACIYLIKSFCVFLILRLKGIEYDIVSVHFTLEGILMRLIGRIFSVPYLFFLEGYTDEEAREAKWANLQIAITKYAVNKCFEKFGYKPIYIPEAVCLEKFKKRRDKHKIRKRLGIHSDAFVVLTVCRLAPDKNIPALVRAAKIVCEKDPKILFVIVGDGSEKVKIEKMINQLDLQNNVTMTGMVSDDELPEYYGCSDLYVLPEAIEAYQGGLVFLEAMGSGCPIISTDIEGTREYIRECAMPIQPSVRRGGWAFVSPSTLAQKILLVAYNDELRQRMRQKGFKIVKTHDWNKLIIKYERTYSSIIKNIDAKQS